jgi:hypothetical protein
VRQGQPLRHGHVVAPMYVATQEWDDCVELRYLMLYAHQGGQACRGLPSSNHFNCIVHDLGRHQGDLEWISVLVNLSLDRLLAVGFASHGDLTYFLPGQYLVEGTHPLVRVALNGHSCRNGFGKNDDDWIYTFEQPGSFATVDIITKGGPTWRPFEYSGGLVLLGLNEVKDPINHQIWVKFSGKIGKTLDNRFVNVTDVDGASPLKDFEDRWVRNAFDVAKPFLPSSLQVGEAPDAPGAHDFVRTPRPRGIRLWHHDNGYTGFNTSARPSIVAHKGLFHVFFRDHGGNGLMHITSPDGISWSPADPFRLDITTSAGPCPLAGDDALDLFFRDGTGNGILQVRSRDGGAFAAVPNGSVGLDCDGQPMAARWNARVCVVASEAGGDGIVRAVRVGAAAWSQGHTGFHSSARPAVVAFKGAFHVFFRDRGAHPGLMHITSPDGISWSQARTFHPGFTTSAGPCAVVIAEQLHLFFRDGTGNGILHIVSSDGDRFDADIVPNWYAGVSCDGEPAAAALGDRVCVVATDHNGKGIMRSVLRSLSLF